MSETDMTDYAELRAALNAGPKGKWKVQRPNAGVRGRINGVGMALEANHQKHLARLEAER